MSDAPIPNPMARPQAKVAAESIAQLLTTTGESFAEWCWRCGYASPPDPNPWPRAGRFWLFRGWKR